MRDQDRSESLHDPHFPRLAVTHHCRQALTDLALIAAFCVVLFSPFILLGIPGGLPDQDHHLRIASSIHESLLRGSLLPDVVLTENNGYGSYTIRLYPTLFHSSVAAAKFAVPDWGHALCLTLLFFAIAGAFGIYLLTKCHDAGRWAAVASSLTYLLLPYWVNHAYNGFFYGEFAAMAVLPYCFLFVRRLCDRPDLTNAVFLALAFAALVLSNTPQTVIGTIALAVYGLMHFDRDRATKQIIYTAVAALVATSLTLGLIVRLAYEASWFKIAQQIADPSYDFRNNFGLDFWPSDYTTDSSWLATIFMSMTVAVLAVALLSARQPGPPLIKRSIAPALAAFLFALFLSSPLSAGIWELSTLLQRTQFPWRFLSVLNLSAAVILGYSFERVSRMNGDTRRPRQMVLVGLLMIIGTFTVKQVILAANFTAPEQFDSRMNSIGTSATLDHWNPVWLNEDSLLTSRPEVEIDHRSSFVSEWSDGKILIEVTDGPVAQMRLRRIYHPYWSAQIGNVRAPVVKDETGLLNVEIPEGPSAVELVFMEPRPVILAEWFGLITLFCIGLFLIFKYQPNRIRVVYAANC